jgi:pimeloyl-ACP methyl ester carboxylesterase
MSEELTRRRVNSLRIDLNGCGESEGNFKYQTITSTVSDVEGAIEYVKSLGYNKIDLFGASAGGLTAMATALKHPEINRLGLKCPVSDYATQQIRRIGEDNIEEWKKNGVTLYVDTYGEKHDIDYSVFEDYKNHVMFDKVKNIKCPVLICTRRCRRSCGY